jgi:hypothetical protein
MAEKLEERLDEAADDEEDLQADVQTAEADEEPGCTVEGGLARL